HYAVLDVTPTSAGMFLRITAMSAADPIRHMHVWMPDYNGQSFAGQDWHPGADFSPCHPLFLERLSPFHALRFMHWQATDSSNIQHWSDRRPADYARQSTFDTMFQNGVAPEYMVELANELDADPWFNMPAM